MSYLSSPKKNNIDRKKSLSGELIELVIFIIFLLATTIVALSSRHLYMFYFNKTIDDLFLTFDSDEDAEQKTLKFYQLVTQEDWWNFLELSVLPDLHDAGEDVDADRKLLFENLLLGPPRLRQIRVQERSCQVHQAFSRYFDKCYETYAISIEDRREEFKGTKFYTLDELYGTSVWAKFGVYKGGGYVKNLSFNRTENEKMLADLKAIKWIDRGTRVVMFEMTLYNANTNLFNSAKFIAELPPSGGIVPSSYLQAIKLYTFWNEGDIFVLLCGLVFYMLTLYYTKEEIVELVKIGIGRYIRSLWNMVDFAIIVMAYISFVYNIWHPIHLNQVMQRFARDPDHFQSLDIIAHWNLMYIDMMAICTFIVWIKTFKYISFSKTMLQFGNTFKRCAKDLFGFTVMFSIVFVAYAGLGFILFGSNHTDFRTFKESFLTMMRMVLGDFEYNNLEEANRILGPIFFVTFTVIVFFILLNMFIAIITDTYTEVKSEIQYDTNRMQTFIKSIIVNMLNFLRNCRKSSRNNEKQKQSVDSDYIKANEFQENILDEPPNNMSQTSVRPINSAATQKSTTPLRVKKSTIYKDYFEEIKIDADIARNNRLSQRVEVIEQILEQLVVNLDEILAKIDTQKRKNKI